MSTPHPRHLARRAITLQHLVIETRSSVLLFNLARLIPLLSFSSGRANLGGRYRAAVFVCSPGALVEHAERNAALSVLLPATDRIAVRAGTGIAFRSEFAVYRRHFFLQIQRTDRYDIA